MSQLRLVVLAAAITGGLGGCLTEKHFDDGLCSGLLGPDDDYVYCGQPLDDVFAHLNGARGRSRNAPPPRCPRA
jgi:hypothetical protein